MKIRVPRRPALVLATGLAFSGTPGRASGQACKAADAQTASVLTDFYSLADSTHASQAASRALYQITPVPATQVYLVTTDSLCDRARQALDSVALAKNPLAPASVARPLYVFKIGSVYVVWDPATSAGEWAPLFFFSPSWSLNGIGLF